MFDRLVGALLLLSLGAVIILVALSLRDLAG